MYIPGANMYILIVNMYILGVDMYISWANMYILGANVPLRYQYAAFGYKRVPFEKVQPQWQLLYLFSESVKCNEIHFSNLSYLRHFEWKRFEKNRIRFWDISSSMSDCVSLYFYGYKMDSEIRSKIYLSSSWLWMYEYVWRLSQLCSITRHEDAKTPLTSVCLLTKSKHPAVGLGHGGAN